MANQKCKYCGHAIDHYAVYKNGKHTLPDNYSHRKAFQQSSRCAVILAKLNLKGKEIEDTCDFCDAYDVKGYHIKALDKAELRICQNCFDMPSTVKTKLESEYRASERARIALEIKQGIESGYHKTDEHGEDDIFSCCEDCVEGSEEGIASCPCWQAFWEKYLPDAKKEE